MTASPDLIRLLDIMAQLRDPEHGCPWDLEQSFATIAPYTIEEAYEVAEAAERGEPEALKDELGDLLFAVANLARRLSVDPEQALRGANRKFERRFRAIEERLSARGRPLADRTLDEMEAEWQRVKAEE